MTSERPTAWLFTSTSPAEIFSTYSSLDPQKDLIVAVDNGLERIHALGLTPDLIIGDLDSVSPELLAEYASEPQKKYPQAKNETDTELAILWCLEQNVAEIVICNGLAGRFDHALALLQNLAFIAKNCVRGRLESERQQLLFLEAKTVLKGCAGCMLSLLAWEGEAAFKDSEGLEYPLAGVELSPLRPRGMSNRITSGRAEIQLASGRVLAILSK
jgi:thiamine pyrophosphokinase